MEEVKTKKAKTNAQPNKRNRKDTNASQNSSKKRKIKEERKNANFENVKIFTEEAKENLRLYNKMHTIYEEEGVTQKTHQFLTRITQSKVRELLLIAKANNL
jgi:predicted N-acyltransferase